jgi:hypothetical protein
MQVSDLTYATKTCICGHKIDLTKTKIFAVSDSANQAGAKLRSFNTSKNTEFTSAVNTHDSSLVDKILKKDRN